MMTDRHSSTVLCSYEEEEDPGEEEPEYPFEADLTTGNLVRGEMLWHHRPIP